MRILMVSSEAVPFAKTGGLADAVFGLAKALVELGHEVAIWMPAYPGAPRQPVILPSLTVPLGPQTRFPAVVGGMVEAGVRYFFLREDKFFAREALYGEAGADYEDNAERFALFSRAALELAKLVWRPDILHCHDWQAALVPVWLKTIYREDPVLGSLPVVLTVHNLGYQGIFPPGVLRRVGLPEELFSIERMEFYGQVNFLKGGLVFADWLTTVSPRYAAEIQTEEFGFGLHGVLRQRRHRLLGILNGVDYSLWSPERDPYIAAPYSASDLSGKRACKRDLLACMGLPETQLDKPLVGIISRLVAQKGFDLVMEAGEALLGNHLALVVLGTGEARYEEYFRTLAARRPERVAVRIAYDNTLAHKIEAGADLFLMPSRYEPCGLNQIYSLRYGTVPVVRATGGLDDSIEPFDPQSGRGTGFKFGPYRVEALLETLAEALRTYHQPQHWQRLQRNAMEQDFSWVHAARQYLAVYRQAQEDRIPVEPTASTKGSRGGAHLSAELSRKEL